VLLFLLFAFLIRRNGPVETKIKKKYIYIKRDVLVSKELE
jgi:hypothetical protein